MTRFDLPQRPFAALERTISVIGFGAFKIGRHESGKYEQPYDLPSDAASARLLTGVLDLGITCIDTAPAYGLSESRIGAALDERRGEFVISTKAGEDWVDGVSHHDFSEHGIETSVCRSLVRLRARSLDVVFVHAHGDDLEILRDTPALDTLERLRRQGLLRAIGFSGKSVEAGLEAVADPRVDAVMVEFNPESTRQLPVIEAAGGVNKAVFVKKPLAAGRLPPSEAIPFILARPEVTCAVVGGLDLAHLAEACKAAMSAPTLKPAQESG